MTIWRLTIVSITVLILYVGFYPGTMALGQGFRETSEPGTERQVVAAPGPPAPEANASTLPDAPGVAWQQNGQNTPAPSGARDGAPAGQVHNGGKQTRRILYIIPNFRAVSVDEKLPPQTIKDKFTTGALDSVDYSSFIFVAIQAGVAQTRNATPEFHQGAAGYGRYYWHTYADYVDENLWVEFLLPTALHQDSRYYTLGRGGFAKRLGYSLSRAAITRKDSGHETFNASEIFGIYYIMIAAGKNGLNPVASAKGTAVGDDARTVVTVSLDLRGATPGNYVLSTQLQGEDAPYTYPLQIE